MARRIEKSVRATDKQIEQWADRHDLTFGGSVMAARDAFEDAQSLLRDVKQAAIARAALTTKDTP